MFLKRSHLQQRENRGNLLKPDSRIFKNSDAHQPPLLLLDEATSHLDMLTEARVEPQSGRPGPHAGGDRPSCEHDPELGPHLSTGGWRGGRAGIASPTSGAGGNYAALISRKSEEICGNFGKTLSFAGCTSPE